MEQSNLVLAGRLTRVRGLKGELKMVPDSDAAEALTENAPVYLQPLHGKPVPFFIEKISESGKGLFLKLEDINTKEEAQQLLNHSVWVPESNITPELRLQMPPIELAGFVVVQVPNLVIGTVEEVYDSEADYYLLGVNNHGKEVLIPYRTEFVEETNHQDKTIRVNLPNGMLDL